MIMIIGHIFIVMKPSNMAHGGGWGRMGGVGGLLLKIQVGVKRNRKKETGSFQ